MPVFNAVSPEGPKITGIQYWFSALAFMQIFILCTVDDENHAYIDKHDSEIVS